MEAGIRRSGRQGVGLEAGCTKLSWWFSLLITNISFQLWFFFGRVFCLFGGLVCLFIY